MFSSFGGGNGRRVEEGSNVTKGNKCQGSWVANARVSYNRHPPMTGARDVRSSGVATTHGTKPLVSRLCMCVGTHARTNTQAHICLGMPYLEIFGKTDSYRDISREFLRQQNKNEERWRWWIQQEKRNMFAINLAVYPQSPKHHLYILLNIISASRQVLCWETRWKNVGKTRHVTRLCSGDVSVVCGTFKCKPLLARTIPEPPPSFPRNLNFHLLCFPLIQLAHLREGCAACTSNPQIPVKAHRSLPGGFFFQHLCEICVLFGSQRQGEKVFQCTKAGWVYRVLSPLTWHRSSEGASSKTVQDRTHVVRIPSVRKSALWLSHCLLSVFSLSLCVSH